MRAQKVVAKKFEFYFPELDNLILVENLEDGSVIIRATQDNFTDRRKSLFIRELAAEGFIPDIFQWWNGSACGLTWVIDRTWLKLPAVWRRKARKFMVKLLVVSGVLWLAMMRVICVSQPGNPHAGDAHGAKPVSSTAHFGHR